MSVLRKIYISLRHRLGFKNTVSVGHAVAGGNCMVSISFNGQEFYLSPEGARQVATQLTAWADHADSSKWEAMTTMQWVVKLTLDELTAVHAASEVRNAS